MKTIYALLALLIASPLWAAAPNDITSGQRVWFDGLDTSGQGYSSTTVAPSNPINGATFSSWNSKINGYTANATINGATAIANAPTYAMTTLGIGASYPGNAVSRRSLAVANDIWGPTPTTVTTFDNFVVASSSNPANNGFLFGSELQGALEID